MLVQFSQILFLLLWSPFYAKCASSVEEDRKLFLIEGSDHPIIFELQTSGASVIRDDKTNAPKIIHSPPPQHSDDIGNISSLACLCYSKLPIAFNTLPLPADIDLQTIGSKIYSAQPLAPGKSANPMDVFPPLLTSPWTALFPNVVTDFKKNIQILDRQRQHIWHIICTYKNESEINHMPTLSKQDFEVVQNCLFLHSIDQLLTLSLSKKCARDVTSIRQVVLCRIKGQLPHGLFKPFNDKPQSSTFVLDIHQHLPPWHAIAHTIKIHTALIELTHSLENNPSEFRALRQALSKKVKDFLSDFFTYTAHSMLHHQASASLFFPNCSYIPFSIPLIEQTVALSWLNISDIRAVIAHLPHNDFGNLIAETSAHLLIFLHKHSLVSNHKKLDQSHTGTEQDPEEHREVLTTSL